MEHSHSDWEILPENLGRLMVVKKRTGYSNFEIRVDYRGQFLPDTYHDTCSDVNGENNEDA